MLAAAPDIQLPRRAVYTLPDAAGVRVACHAGSLWITLDHDPRDYVLEAGASFQTGDHRRAVLYAIEDSSFGLAR